MPTMLTSHHVIALAQCPGPWATISMPLSGGGPLAKPDPVVYRNLVREIADQLDARATEPSRREAITSALRELEHVHEVFNSGAKGLVVFANENGIEHWHFPVALEARAVLDERPHIEPLIPIVTDPMHFYVVQISLHSVRVIECSRFVARELPLPPGTPTRLEEAVGWEVEEPSLQYHTGRGPHALGGAADRPMYHTQGGGKDDREADFFKFVRDVDGALWSTIVHKSSPVVLVTSEKLEPIFRRTTRLPNMVTPAIHGGADRVPIEELHARARALLEPGLRAHVEAEKERFGNLLGSGAATSRIEQVVLAAVDGRVDTLFVREGAHVDGHVDETTHSVRVGNGRADTTDLVDRATCDTFLTGGKIYRLRADQMPIAGEVAAILRY
jgi:hypothetical protein